MAYFGPNPQTIQSGSLDSLRNLSDLSNTALARTNLSVPSQAEFNKALTTDPEAFTEAQKGQARANIDGHVLAGFRNKLINPTWRVCQRATSGSLLPGGIAWVGDRWQLYNATDQTLNWSVTLNAGANGIPKYVSRYLVVSFPVAPILGVVSLFQSVEDVFMLAGGKATGRAYVYANVPFDAYVVARQNFGAGGSPPVVITSSTQTINSPDSLFPLQELFDLPNVDGKSIGVGSHVQFNPVIIPRHATSYLFTAASFVEGDARSEPDIIAERHIGEEMALCQRYFQRTGTGWHGVPYSATQMLIAGNYPTMRADPTVSVIAGGGTSAITFATGNFSFSESLLNSAFRINGGWAYIGGTNFPIDQGSGVVTYNAFDLSAELT